MNIAPRLTVAVCLTAAAPVLAQNLVINGDFETGTLPPWTFTADPNAEPAMIASVEQFQNSLMFRVNPGHDGSGGAAGGNLEQEITLAAGAHYIVSGDLFIENIGTLNNVQGGLIEVSINGQLLFVADQGSISGQTVIPFSFNEPYEAVTAGTHTLRLRFTREWRNFSPAILHRADNISVIADTLPCYANCDGSTTEPILTVDDFTCFINEFAAAQALPTAQQIEHYANCDGSTTEPVLTVDDFTCFINAFAQGCP